MQANDTRSVAEREADTDRALMAMLLADPGLWSVDEAKREAGGNPLLIEDGLNRLHAAGLIHRVDGKFVFPTKAAIRASEIAG